MFTFSFREYLTNLEAWSESSINHVDMEGVSKKSILPHSLFNSKMVRSEKTVCVVYGWPRRNCPSGKSSDRLFNQILCPFIIWLVSVRIFFALYVFMEHYFWKVIECPNFHTEYSENNLEIVMPDFVGNGF